MKKLLTLFFITTALFLISGCNNKTTNYSNSNLKPAEDKTDMSTLQMEVKTDKSVYHSYEKIILNITLKSDIDITDAIVSAQGIKGRLNNLYFNRSQKISLQKDVTEQLELSETLPSCNSCSGLAAGDYIITVSVLNQNKQIVVKTVSITIKQ